MGRVKRTTPADLHSKLASLRNSLGLTQQGMAAKLSSDGIRIQPGHVSEYESGKRVPNLLVLLRYSEMTGISVNMLIDDKQTLSTRALKRIS